MAIKVKLDCRAAWEKVKEHGYRYHIPIRAIKVYIPNGTHIDVYGRAMSLKKLAELLIEGTDHIPPRPFITDSAHVLNAELRKLMRDSCTIKKKNTRNPNYLGDVYIKLDKDVLCTKTVALIKNWLYGSYYSSTIPNAKKTVEHKGFNKPLVETGALVNSISAKVVLGKGKY